MIGIWNLGPQTEVCLLNPRNLPFLPLSNHDHFRNEDKTPTLFVCLLMHAAISSFNEGNWSDGWAGREARKGRMIMMLFICGDRVNLGTIWWQAWPILTVGSVSNFVTGPLGFPLVSKKPSEGSKGHLVPRSLPHASLRPQTKALWKFDYFGNNSPSSSRGKLCAQLGWLQFHVRNEMMKPCAWGFGPVINERDEIGGLPLHKNT